MAEHLTFRGNFALVARYLPFARKELRRLKKQREKRGNASLSRVFRGTDGVLGLIRLSTNRTEDHIHIELFGGKNMVFLERAETISIPAKDSKVWIADEFTVVSKIRHNAAHLYTIKPNKVRQSNKELLGGAIDQFPAKADSYDTPAAYGNYIIVPTAYFHAFIGPPPGATTPGDIKEDFEGPYREAMPYSLFKASGGSYVLQGSLEELDSVAGSPTGEETMWSDFSPWSNHEQFAPTVSTNHLSTDGKTLTSYVMVSNTYYYLKTGGAEFNSNLINGDYHTLTPYIVKRDLSQGIQPTEIKQTLSAFTQDFTGEKEYYSPNHHLDTLLYDVVGGLNGFRGHDGLIAVDQDSVHMTTHKRTRPGHPSLVEDLTIEESLISINIETGAETVQDTWFFNHSLVSKGNAKALFTLLRPQLFGDSNVVGWVEGNHAVDDLKFYAGPKSDGLSGAQHKFTISSLHEIFRQASEPLAGHYDEAFSVTFWSINNAVSWEDSEGGFQDNQVYGIVATGKDEDLTGADDPSVVRLYKSQGGQTPVLIKEYQQHLGSESDGYVIRTSGKHVFLFLPGRDASDPAKIPRIWKIFNMETETDQDVAEGLLTSFPSGIAVLDDFHFLTRPPRRYR